MDVTKVGNLSLIYLSGRRGANVYGKILDECTYEKWKLNYTFPIMVTILKFDQECLKLTIRK